MPRLERLRARWSRAAESPAVLLVWFVGLLLVLGAVYVLWATTDLRALVPEGVVVALILLILGIAIMGAAARFGPTEVASTESDREVPTRAPVRREREHHMPEWERERD